jgi:hypothetical protein
MEMKKIQIAILFLSLLSVFACANRSNNIKNGLSSILNQEEKSPIDMQTHSVSHEMRIITAEELCNPNKDTLLFWENGGFLSKRNNKRNYKMILSNHLQQDSLSVWDIENLYPTSVEEMNWFYSQLKSTVGPINRKMNKIDSLMTLFADLDTLSCLPRFLNMYLLMDPRVIDREWMGDWDLNRVMYSIIPDNKQSFKSYYDTLDTKYEWVVRAWCYAYQNF